MKDTHPAPKGHIIYVCFLASSLQLLATYSLTTSVHLIHSPHYPPPDGSSNENTPSYSETFSLASSGLRKNKTTYACACTRPLQLLVPSWTNQPLVPTRSTERPERKTRRTYSYHTKTPRIEKGLPHTL
jgi:hypothetical protein